MTDNSSDNMTDNCDRQLRRTALNGIRDRHLEMTALTDSMTDLQE